MRNDLVITAFTSGKGGCGKTTIAVNFAYTLYRTTKKVLLIDFDLSNRGTSGLFSKATQDQEGYLTLTQILRNQTTSKWREMTMLEPEPGFYLIPATSPGEEAWVDSDLDLDLLVDKIRGSLEKIAEQHDIPAIVCDCFCGVDTLTTSVAGFSDHTIIVNEPDVVTFNGTVVLLNHLKKSYADSKYEPNIQFVINRVRGDNDINRLAITYESNLESEIKGAILVYFPYNAKIFKNFGTYPLLSKLIPKSLFSKKLDLLAYKLFIETNPELLDEKVRRWAKGKIESLYFKGIDPSSIDTEYLILKLTSAPVYIGLIGLIATILLKTLTSPSLIWIFGILASAVFIGFFIEKIIKTVFLIARLNFSVSTLRKRLKDVNALQIKTHPTIDISMPFLGGLFSLVATGIFAIYLSIFGYNVVYGSLLGFRTGADSMIKLESSVLEGEYNMSGFGRSSTEDRLDVLGYDTLSNWQKFEQTMIRFSLGLPVTQLNLSGRSVISKNLEDMQPLNQIESKGLLDKISESNLNPNQLLVDNTSFELCRMPTGTLTGNKLTGTNFKWSVFNEESNFLGNYDFNKMIESDSTNYSDVTIEGFPERAGILFNNCTFNSGNTIKPSEDQFVLFNDCTLHDNLFIEIKGEQNFFLFTNSAQNLDFIKSNRDYEVVLVDDSTYFKILPLEIMYYKENAYKMLEGRKDKGIFTTDNDLIEMFVMLQSERSFFTAELLISERLNNEPRLSNYDKGVMLMLKLQLEVLRDSSWNDIENVLTTWKKWMLDWDERMERQNSEVLTGRWNFNLINRHFSYHAPKYSAKQLAYWEAIQQFAYSEISADSLDKVFQSDYEDVLTAQELFEKARKFYDDIFERH